MLQNHRPLLPLDILICRGELCISECSGGKGVRAELIVVYVKGHIEKSITKEKDIKVSKGVTAERGNKIYTLQKKREVI